MENILKKNTTGIGRSTLLLTTILVFTAVLNAQQVPAVIDSFRLYGDVKITVDKPTLVSGEKTIVIFYALPNGNTTEQTMGKIISPGEDWHFDIQHIRAQTTFIRRRDKKNNYIVIYLENIYKSWPAWKQHNPHHKTLIPYLVDSLTGKIGVKNVSIYLNGHSGGGSFIFGYLAGVKKIPGNVKRISFIDSNYGYDSSYHPKISDWLKQVKGATLTVFAYNDSIALLNNKPFVSATGGTWYKSYLMMSHLQNEIVFRKTITDSFFIYNSRAPAVYFFMKKNLNRGIYHTQQVELNGFIHSVFCGTRFELKGYNYYGRRAYKRFIK